LALTLSCPLPAPAPTAFSTLSLHDALPISRFGPDFLIPRPFDPRLISVVAPAVAEAAMTSGVATRPIKDMPAYRRAIGRHVLDRSEEHTSELQSPYDLVCRLLLEKKKRLSR